MIVELSCDADKDPEELRLGSSAQRLALVEGMLELEPVVLETLRWSLPWDR